MRTVLKLGLRLAPRAAVAVADWVVYTIADTIFLWRYIGELQDEHHERPAYPMPDTTPPPHCESCHFAGGCTSGGCLARDLSRPDSLAAQLARAEHHLADRELLCPDCGEPRGYDLVNERETCRCTRADRDAA